MRDHRPTRHNNSGPHTFKVCDFSKTQHSQFSKVSLEIQHTFVAVPVKVLWWYLKKFVVPTKDNLVNRMLDGMVLSMCMRDASIQYTAC